MRSSDPTTSTSKKNSRGIVKRAKSFSKRFSLGLKKNDTAEFAHEILLAPRLRYPHFHPLTFAIYFEQVDIVDDLIDLPTTKPNEVDPDGNTSFHYAAYLSNDSICRRFIENPKILTLPNYQDIRPHDYVINTEKFIHLKREITRKARFDAKIQKYVATALMPITTHNISTEDIKKLSTYCSHHALGTLDTDVLADVILVEYETKNETLPDYIKKSPYYKNDKDFIKQSVQTWIV